MSRPISPADITNLHETQQHRSPSASLRASRRSKQNQQSQQMNTTVSHLAPPQQQQQPINTTVSYIVPPQQQQQQQQQQQPMNITVPHLLPQQQHQHMSAAICYHQPRQPHYYVPDPSNAAGISVVSNQPMPIHNLANGAYYSPNGHVLSPQPQLQPQIVYYVAQPGGTNIQGISQDGTIDAVNRGLDTFNNASESVSQIKDWLCCLCEFFK